MLKRLQGKQGFSLIEMAIVLLIAGLLTAGAVQLMTNMQQQRTDQAAANEMRNIVAALERFMVDQQAVLTNPTSASPLRLANQSVLLASGSMRLDYGNGLIDSQKFFEDNYLGIRPTEPLGSDLRLLARGYRIGLRNLGTVTGSSKPILKALVTRTPTNNMNESRLSRVASLVGSQGGLVRDNGAGAPEISGVQGSWRVIASDYAMVGPAAPVIGQIAAYTATIDSNMNTNILSRTNTGNAEANTMRTDLFMGRGNTPALARSIFGLGMLETDASLSTNCAAGSLSITPIDFVTGLRGTPVSYTIGLGTNQIDPVRLQNAVVYGFATAPNRTLLQCRESSPGVWQWQLAFPSADNKTWVKFLVPSESAFPQRWGSSDYRDGNFFTNTTGGPIEVSISHNGCRTGSRQLWILPAGISPTLPANWQASGQRIGISKTDSAAGYNDPWTTLYATIPDGVSYKVVGCTGNLRSWFELRP
ncbi:MAG TPA: type II secretion system protein [Alphaproteobacteria bacterium]|nr:hypothetical protein [Rhodospirillaceae bacterium]HRJ11757.1 type II secretion system protein [Alphaproteobacteria bacterium]